MSSSELRAEVASESLVASTAGITRSRYAQGNGAADAGAEDLIDRVNDLEERRSVRSEETELGDIAVSSDHWRRDNSFE